ARASDEARRRTASELEVDVAQDLRRALALAEGLRHAVDPDEHGRARGLRARAQGFRVAAGASPNAAGIVVRACLSSLSTSALISASPRAPSCRTLTRSSVSSGPLDDLGSVRMPPTPGAKYLYSSPPSRMTTTFLKQRKGTHFV